MNNSITIKNITVVKNTKLGEQFSGISEDVRQLLIKAGNLKLSASDSEIFSYLDDLFGTQKRLKEENYQLRYEKAQIEIERLCHAGMIEVNEKDDWIKLATGSFDTTMNVIKKRGADKKELTELLKLNGYQLYINGRLERLKELSEYHFKLKYSELQTGNQSNPPNSQTLELTQEYPESELDSLLRLSAKELYTDGLLERLKELDFGQFKLKYKEFFNLEYPF